MKFYIGIDIGKEGRIVVQNNENTEIDSYVMPKIANEFDIHEFYKILNGFKGKECHVVFENLTAIFGSSAGSTFTFAFIAGSTEAIVIALGLPYTKIQAKTWQKEMFAGIPEIRKPSSKNKKGVEVKGRIDTKPMALIAAKRLFPNFAFTLSPKAKNYHDGEVDALLISEYCKRNFR